MKSKSILKRLATVWTAGAAAMVALAGPPSVVMLPPSQVIATSASISGTVNPNGLNTAVYVRYGLTTNYGSLTAPVLYPGAAPAVAFNGVNQYAAVAGSVNFAPTNEITVEFWQRAEAAQPQSTFILNPDSPTDRLNAHTPWSDGGVYWDFGNINGGGRLAYPPAPGLLQTWQHFAFVASQSGNYMRVYQNGVQVATQTGMTPLTRRNADFNIAGGVNGYYFKGELAEFRVWNQALDQVTIQTWMSRALTAAHPAWSNLVGYWPMNEGGGTTLVDNSQHGLNATTINNPVWTNGPSLTNYIYQTALTGLVPGGVYHCQLAASNSAGLAYSADFTFSTIGFANLNVPLPSLLYGTMVCGDLDNDGRLDIVVSGNCGDYVTVQPRTQVWRNHGNGVFELASSANLPQLSHSTLALADFDRDGLLDLVIAGQDPANALVCQVWRGQGDGTFVNWTSNLSSGVIAAMAVGDFDGDGYPDIVLTGSDASGVPMTQLWHNQGDGSFVFVPTGITGVQGSVVTGDFDRDGRLDLALVGLSTNGPVSEVWRNVGNNHFANMNAGLTPLAQGSLSVADYDNDGWLDILLTGEDGASHALTQIWRNTGHGFTNIQVNLPALASGTGVWGDFNNDGWPDVLLTGTDAQGRPINTVFRNTGNGFVDANAGLPTLPGSGALWADFDNDGRLDLLLFGGEPTYLTSSELWGNGGPVTNTPPVPPGGLTVSAAGTGVTLGWSAASDAQTPSAGLTYNVRVGTSPGGSDLVSPLSAANGWRRLPQMGNAQQNLSATLALASGRTYYWSVQAVDGALAGSAFAPEQHFTLSTVLTPASGVPVPGDQNGDGIVDQAELLAVLAAYWQNHPPAISSEMPAGQASFEFGVSNLSALNLTVLATTNPALPRSEWEVLGPASLSYAFSDPVASNAPQRYYQLRWP